MTQLVAGEVHVLSSNEPWEHAKRAAALAQLHFPPGFTTFWSPLAQRIKVQIIIKTRRAHFSAF